MPYWSCFGVDNSNAAVNAEIQDWYDALAARPRELIAWFQSTMSRQQLYDGPVDGGPNAAFRDAVAGTREALGQPRETKLSLEFFKAWVLADAGTIANARATLAAERLRPPSRIPANLRHPRHRSPQPARPAIRRRPRGRLPDSPPRHMEPPRPAPARSPHCHPGPGPAHPRPPRGC